MNKTYWKEFYKKDETPHEPSDFAKWFAKEFKPITKVLELGAGNGRDTYYLQGQGYDIKGIDQSYEDSLIEKKDIKDITGIVGMIVYSRFFIHAITKKECRELLDKIDSGFFVAEFRVREEDVKVYKDHKRTYWDGLEFEEELTKRGFDVVYNKTSKGWAKYKDEDPLVMRVIAYKN